MKNLLFALFLSCASHFTFAQNITITPTGITPLQGGSPYPRLGYEQILALPSPQAGDMAFDNTFRCLRTYTGYKWLCTDKNPQDPTPDITLLSSFNTATTPSFTYSNASDATIDTQGNFYILGKTNSSQLYLTKRNPSGAEIWNFISSGSSFQVGARMGIDASGNIYVTGKFSNTVTLGNTTLTAVGGSDIFICKLNNSGVVQWAKREGGIQGEGAFGIRVDAAGDLYTCGSFEGLATFSGQSRTSIGFEDAYLTKYNTAGTLQWIQTVGGISPGDGTIFNDIVITSTGKVVVTGQCYRATFGTIVLSNIGGGFNFCLAQYDPVINSWVWAKNIGGPGMFVDGVKLAIGNSDNIYLAGTYYCSTNTCSMAFSNIVSLTNSTTNKYTFLASYTALGNFISAQAFTGESVGSCIPKSLLAVGSSVYIEGAFFGSINFGGIHKSNITNLSSGGIFIANSNGSNIEWVQTILSKVANTGFSPSAIVKNSQDRCFAIGNSSANISIGAVPVPSPGGVFIARLQEE